ncbi:DUF433 domain-containing protein [Longimicrobium sp.]|uniref:DUF433 domain-containing protein n=1 Tax=Longimicrobium sp. TaxID=2029185 RepID=UPI002E37BF99|nr:DUF433 domain-containing protein [Longimicrobium sp.]HEX6039346.1 DUF433 domain-containing protein [Longimicrobium sp.]
MLSRRHMGGRGLADRIIATVNEAAFVSGVSRHAVNQAIDRGEIRTHEMRFETDASGRTVGVAELIYLHVQDVLSTSSRRVVYKKLVRFNADLDSVPPTIEMANGVKLDITGSVAEIRTRLDELSRIKGHVEENPEVRGGEPVFRGTRIPVQMIASFVRDGIPAEEILEDYPALAPGSLEIATRYAELYPRRGRPRQAPWRTQAPTHVIHPDEPRA